MAFGVQAPGPVPDRPGGFRTRPEYLQAMVDEVRAEAVDIVLTSASNGERLIRERVLDASGVTLAVRANDTTDIWNPRGGRYPARPSRPFRTANLRQVRELSSLVLYSVTFNNDLDHDLATLEQYAAFRAEAHDVGIRHFLEVFNPNAPVDLAPADVGAFVNDHIIRLLAGVTQVERPLFLKLAYNGPEAMTELVSHDPSLVVGVLGGSAGTTRDTLELLAQAEQHGARVALFGRKVQRAESQLDLLASMRAVVSRRVGPEEAVAAYHDALRSKGITPARTLAEDQVITEPILAGG
jgi:DhnA family fructose-bisphosphate aldolase class Ia